MMKKLSACRSTSCYSSRSLFGRIYFSPMEETLKRGARVLDVGAGPGLWIRDMAEQYPNSHFTGTDAMIYPISTPPKNCQLRIADAAEGLPFPDNTFDFVLQHDGLMRYTHSEWDMAIKELVRVLKPGGWIELVECSCALQDIGPNLSIWLMRLTVSLQSRNINVKMASQLNRYLEKAGSLENVEFSHRSVPIGWLGKLGDLMLECMERLFDSMKPRLCEDWSMSLSKYDKIVQAASKECREFKSWTNVHYAYGRKL
ncbi:S-adenosyl-L-methionine-dependent methyltransferase [Syncephalastrum racemosum]|uniref:S-adenosyl-L-methionine-dependent methyltransferase n=1 Tax=Syncephalastrum racemosum TaxID=13706 RepID=A0A1X2H4C6_SYNRA|nr:S-adenosyl-L-methionine-dependent methyltransferase [Syncephalastrum racemosum]